MSFLDDPSDKMAGRYHPLVVGCGVVLFLLSLIVLLLVWVVLSYPG